MSSRQEVDKILLHQLKEVGCDLEKSSIKDLGKEDIYKSAVICVRQIYEQNDKTPEDFPADFPLEPSQRFRICTDLASCIRDIGYKQEISFDTFLYPNENTTRALLAFLMEQIHGKISGSSEGAAGDRTAIVEEEKRLTLNERISQTFSGLVRSTWTKPIADFSKANKIVDQVASSGSSSGKQFKPFQARLITTVYEPVVNQYEERFQKKFCPFITQQVAPQSGSLAPSVYEDNLSRVSYKHEQELDFEEFSAANPDSGLNKDQYAKKKRSEALRQVADILRASNQTATERQQKLSLRRRNERQADTILKRRVMFEADDADVAKQVGNVKSENPQEEEAKRAKEISDLEELLNKINNRMDEIRKATETMNSSILQAEEGIQNEKLTKTKLEENFKVKKTLANLLKDKDKNIKEMEQIAANAGQHLIDLASEWEQHRLPLIEKYRNLKRSIQERKGSYRKLLEQAKTQRDSMKKAIQDIRQKEELIAQMKKDLEAMPKDVERSHYVNRIYDVVRNVGKQKKEIAKIILENNDLQRSVVNQSDKILRSFKEAEEIIFKDAAQAKEEYAKVVYKSLVDVHKAMDSVVDYIKEMGQAQNQIRDFEFQVEQLTARNDAQNMANITSDLEAIKKENVALIAQLKQ